MAKSNKRFMGEIKVAQRLKKELDRTVTVKDYEGNIRSKTVFNNAERRFNRLENKLFENQNRLDESKLRGQRIKSNLKGIVKMGAKKLAKKALSSHPIAAIIAQTLMPSKLGDSTRYGSDGDYKVTYNKKK